MQQFERVGGAQRAFFFDDGEHLVFQIAFAHVEERLPCHGRVLHLLLFGHQREHGFHQGRLARCGTGLHQDRERRVEQARSHRQITHQLVRLLAHHAATFKVGEDAVQQARIAQQFHRCRALLLADRDLFFLRL